MPTDSLPKQMSVALRRLLILVPCSFVAVAAAAYGYTYPEMAGLLKPCSFFWFYEEADYAVFYFTPGRHRQLPPFALTLALLSLLAAAGLWRRTGRMAQCLAGLFRQTGGVLSRLKSHLGTLSPGRKRLLTAVLLAIAAYRVVMACRISPYPDEIWSYISFVSQGWLVTLTYYPDTNNHVLFNLLCIPFRLLSDSPALVMKLPTFLTGMLLLGVIFAVVSVRVSYEAALLSIVLSGFLPETALFSVVGRGHTLAALLAVVSSFCIIEYLSGSGKRPWCLFWFTITAILGFWTVPSFLYHMFSLYLFLVLAGAMRSRRIVKDLFLSGLVIAAGTLLLYSPIMLASGVDSLFGNRWVQPHPLPYFLQSLPIVVAEQLEYLFSLHLVVRRGYLYALIGLGFLLFAALKGQLPEYCRNWIVLTLTSVAGPLILTVLMRVPVPYRVFIYVMYMLHMALAFTAIYAAQKFLIPFFNRSKQPAPVANQFYR